MIRRPPRSPLFPYPPLFRSAAMPTASNAFVLAQRNHAAAEEVSATVLLSTVAAAVLFPITAWLVTAPVADRKSTRLNSSHAHISYAVLCLKKKKKVGHHSPP